MLNKTHAKYFHKACEIAKLSDFNGVHIGCVAVYKNTIIGVGYNSNKTHPIQKYYNRYRKPDGQDTSMVVLPKIHAEINCLNSIRHLNINFKKVKLYVYRICKERKFGVARPCPSCFQAIRDLGIRDIYYTTDVGFAYERILNMEGVA